jgi:hypothetical protein
VTGLSDASRVGLTEHPPGIAFFPCGNAFQTTIRRARTLYNSLTIGSSAPSESYSPTHGKAAHDEEANLLRRRLYSRKRGLLETSQTNLQSPIRAWSIATAHNSSLSKSMSHISANYYHLPPFPSFANSIVVYSHSTLFLQNEGATYCRLYSKYVAYASSLRNRVIQCQMQSPLLGLFNGEYRVQSRWTTFVALGLL